MSNLPVRISYHSAKDRRFPEIFTCFDCRVRQDPSWAMLKGGAYQKMLIDFQDLALFRLVRTCSLASGLLV